MVFGGMGELLVFPKDQISPGLPFPVASLLTEPCPWFELHISLKWDNLVASGLELCSGAL